MRDWSVTGVQTCALPIYEELARQLAALIEGERDLIANSANMAALIFDALPDLNWAGFYFARQNELVLGPFQGKPACIRIAWSERSEERRGGKARAGTRTA